MHAARLSRPPTRLRFRFDREEGVDEREALHDAPVEADVSFQ
jgi:hypothetical protein